MFAFDAPLVARFFAIEELRAAGWRHVLESPSHGSSASKRTKDDAERMWSGATYCPECAVRASQESERAMSRGARERRVS